ncbi:hypothetical protein [Helicobacter sp. 11S02629-2]|uniref:hypothetical protein n=1 Tax=Helicobacter sp. 11S02629-2 TaxID=1476195 RepID=UPI000BA62D23|nr:hypothetical protein [Helicobacter sp. 11S02629-2]PAF43258.1 hypothetical protein BKH40_07075 [Helicobacter sp. 11S02629-2]
MIFVFIDSKCDICQNYQKFMSMKKRRELTFIDLRDKAKVKNITPKILLLDPNSGMIVYDEGKDLLLQGYLALSYLHAKNRFQIFAIRIIYLLLKLVRKVILRLKRVRDIDFKNAQN